MCEYTLKRRILQSIFSIIIMSFVLQVSAFAGSSKLDSLFLDLKIAENESDAIQIEKKIWDTWMKSGDHTIDTLLKEALRKRRSYDYAGSIDILNKIIAIKPDFSEAWNQRATLYFFQEKYEKSLIDIAKTLELEPRHFGSLAGRAVIRLRQSKPVLARQNIIEAMKLHPFLKERHMFPNLQKS